MQVAHARRGAIRYSRVGMPLPAPDGPPQVLTGQRALAQSIKSVSLPTRERRLRSMRTQPLCHPAQIRR